MPPLDTDPIAQADLGSLDVFDPQSLTTEQPLTLEPQPLYQIYEGSKIAISKQVGRYWQRKYEAAVKAYTQVRLVWEEVYRYYNHSQDKAVQTPRGYFKRGDSTENIIFSNLNIMLPAIYSRDPDVTCSTNDKADEPFTTTLEAVLNAIFKRKHLLNAKPKIKKAAGVALLTNFGVYKLDWTKKNDSAELASQELVRITEALVQAEDQNEVSDLYGQLEALEQNMEVMKKSGPSLSNILPHNLIIDPYAEQSDGMDAMWMVENIWLPTASLKERFTIVDEDGFERTNAPRSLLYKPTHKAVFTDGADGGRDDALGMVLKSLSGGADIPVNYQNQERQAYIDMYFTECRCVWDKALKRVMLFHRDDWTWPLWVWDDPLGITRFFPYFIVGFTMTTGGTIGVGETAYILDQQDEINDINRQVARIRRSVFDYFYFNSDVIDRQEAEKFIEAIRSPTAPSGRHVLGVKAGEGGKISDMIQAFAPPSVQYEQLFDKKNTMDTINRITNTSDALRGVQFKTNTNVASVQSYQDSMRLSIGAKVDVIEDSVADLALAVGELSVQNYSMDDVIDLVGQDQGQYWRQMSVQEFTQKYSVTIVAGSMEKPNSTFRKQEAIQVAQAVGQFARAAPGAVSKIMLRVLQGAFTEVSIKPEDWDMLDNEVNANLQKGVSQPQQGVQTGALAQPGASPPAGAPTGGGREEILNQAQKLPAQRKAEVVAMANRGEPPQNILQFIKQNTGAQ